MGVVAARGTASRRGRYRASSAPRLPTGASIAIIFAITLHAWTYLPAVTAFDGQVQIDTSPRDDSEYVSVDMAVPDAVASKPDTYAYTFAAMPTDGHHHIAWFEPKAVAPKVHHMLLFGCAGGVSPNLHTRSGGMFSPGGGEPRGSVCADSPAEPFIFGWGKNAPPLNLPDRVGFEVGGEHGFKHLVLEVHYLDPQPTDANETSGLAVHLRKGRPNRAMSVVAFAQGFTLPPGQARVPVRNACTYTMARPLSAFRVSSAHARAGRRSLRRTARRRRVAQGRRGRHRQYACYCCDDEPMTRSPRCVSWPGTRSSRSCLKGSTIVK